jgi:asparagine synthase (glutamine-hydrolysing)
MCGIVGIVSFDPDLGVDEARLTRMRDALTHRGPDGAGNWVEGPVGFGHRRLAIIDVAGGQQPMTTEDDNVWGVFNGEIYNHAELRHGLEARGHRYRTRTDTETILHLYEEHGDRLVEHMHGMFAIAVWDRLRRRLLLARDRLGIKPLYYAVTQRELLFASEIKAMLAAGFKPVLNDAILPEYLATRYVSGEETFFRGVRKLSPAHTLTWSPGADLARRRYWQIPEPATSAASVKDFDATASDLRDHLRAAVRRHLMSDVPLGVFLSGGIDSSALAGMAAEMIEGPLQTFSVGFQEAEANELPYARLAARRLGAEHREVVVSPAEYFAALPGLIWQEDEPIAFTSSVPLFFVSRLARDHVKVVLTGEGSDELFLGYNRYRVTHWNATLGRPYWAATPRTVRNGVRQLVQQLPAFPRRYAARTFFALDPGERSLFFENFAVFPDRMRHDLLAPADEPNCRDPYAVSLSCYQEGSGNAFDRMSRSDLQTYLHELLMKQDQMSMAASIESRVPFLDDDVVEYVARMPAHFKLRGWKTKAVLRAAVRDFVPAEILTRKKMGFPVPIGRWLRESFQPIVDEFILGDRAATRGLFDRRALRRLAAEHQSRLAEHGDRLWLLANLEIWHRVFVDGETPASVMQPLKKASGRTYARALGEDGRVVAAEHGRPPAQLPHVVGAGAASSGRGGDDPRAGR